MGGVWHGPELAAGVSSDRGSGILAGLRLTRVAQAHPAGARADRSPLRRALVQSAAARDIYTAATAQENGEYFPTWAGQGVGLIQDLPGAGEVVRPIVREAPPRCGASPSAWRRRR